MVSIKINFSNKTFYTLMVVSLLVISGVVYAYNSSPANPAVFGHSINEIEYINEDGSTQNLTEYIRKIADEQITGGAINCPSNPSYDSSTPLSKTNDYQPIILPSNCLEETGCIIVQYIYDSTGLKIKRQYNFNQDSGTNLWWSSYATSGTYKNGDNNYAKIVPSYNGIDILDDSAAEKEAGSITAKDTSTSRGQKVFICSLL